MTIVAVDIGVIEVIELIRPGLGWHYFRPWAITIGPASWIMANLLLNRIYGAERMKREHAFQDHQLTKLPRILAWGLAVMSVVAIVLSNTLGAPAWSAKDGGGTHGTLTITSRRCDSSGDCHWTGTFTSHDGSASELGHQMWDAVPASDGIGSSVPVTDSGSGTFVYATTGSTAWHTFAWMSGAGWAYLTGFLVWRAWRYLRRRAAASG